jgi:hypothetical protein
MISIHIQIFVYLQYNIKRIIGGSDSNYLVNYNVKITSSDTDSLFTYNVYIIKRINILDSKSLFTYNV